MEQEVNIYNTLRYIALGVALQMTEHGDVCQLIDNAKAIEEYLSVEDEPQ